ncbi:streptomycin 6-kinase [Agrobacterium larrymoorei]|uniref:Streptomycin 6-kinase n=1 Tax=Agrobacterium larrymoorei TaxID=160699 RepID=A0AAJ2BBK8_9HYPH|nr:aminoglycoside phosphotransferase family protein [Agrobacterium larrymoorei]MDR6102007.1 streptomycin 6-kinase [Agrobacterium larrymoorei]
MSESIVTSDIPDEIKRRWSISSAFFLADTASSIVHRVTLTDGSSAILKRLKPQGMGERPGMTFLEWRQGQGAVRLLQKNDTECLLEDAGDLTLRTYRLQHGEDATNAIIREVLQKLHAPTAGSPGGLTTLDQHFRFLFARAETESHERLREPLRYSAEIIRELLAHQETVKPLHGDLHHDNIVTGGPRGWLAIDPQGLLGDPAYEVANIFGNPLNALPDILDPQRIKRLCEVFSETLNCSKEKILRYAIAHAGVSICWSLEDGDMLDENENALERLAFLTVARCLLSSDLSP